ncbi:MAG: pyridoxamine 5'-phosphate oxidase family protein [Paracoccaceae bacterium]
MTENWAITLDGHLATAWRLLAEGVAEPQSPARRPVLATTGLDGAPQARTVVLRHADPGAALVEVHTDTQSTKIAELRRDPRAALHVWHPGAEVQLRLSGRVTILTGEAARAYWPAVPLLRVYGGARAGHPRLRATHACSRAATGALAALAVSRPIETVHLAAPIHSRAVFSRGDGWTGDWRAP